MTMKYSPEVLMVLSQLSSIGSHLFSTLTKSAQDCWDDTKNTVLEEYDEEYDLTISDLRKVLDNDFAGEPFLNYMAVGLVSAATFRELTAFIESTHKEVYLHLISGNSNQFDLSFNGTKEAFSLIVATAMDPLWLGQWPWWSNDRCFLHLERIRPKVVAKMGALNSGFSWPVRDGSYIGSDQMYTMISNIENALKEIVDEVDGSQSEAEDLQSYASDNQLKLNYPRDSWQNIPEAIRQYALLLSSVCLCAETIGPPFTGEKVTSYLEEIDNVKAKLRDLFTEKS